MATEMIKGAEYTFGGEQFTLLRVCDTSKLWGIFKHTSGQVYDLRLCDVVPYVKPTPFPEPERWAMSEQDNATLVSVKDTVFYCHNNRNAKTAIALHNAEIDRLMREIRRLEALVKK